MSEPDGDSEVREWLQFADQDLVLARGGLTRRRIFQPRQVCFHSQQAAEKAVKALLIAEGIEFLFIHDLEVLVRSLRELRSLTTPVEDLAWLGQWATATRYPGSAEPDWDDARRAVEIADGLLRDVHAGMGE